jgi:GxxExxY protein
MLGNNLNSWTERLIGAGLEVHSIIGPGYIESVYEEALARELEIRKIPFERQKIIYLHYKGIKVGEGRLDFLINKQIVLELKAVEFFTEVHRAQVISYLKAANLRLGLLMNFNVPSLNMGLKRVILSQRK